MARAPGFFDRLLAWLRDITRRCTKRHGLRSWDLRDIFLWAPFLTELCSRTAGALFLLAHLDGFFIGALPRVVRHLCTLGLVLCLVRMAASAIEGGQGLDTTVATERGTATIGGGDNAVELSWACASMRGWRSSMEDRHIATSLPRAEGGDVGVFAVLDGHGGWQVSAAAEVLLQRILADRLTRHSSKSDLAEVLTDTVAVLDETLLAGPCGLGWLLHRNWMHPFSSTGSTLCLAAVDADRNRIIVANTGDSRAVLSRNGKAVALSEDHKPESASEKARIVKAGGRVSKIGPCWRVDGCLNVSRALGDFRFKANYDLPAADQKISPMPCIVAQEWAPAAGTDGQVADDFLIVACDGLFERMSRQGVVDFVRAALERNLPPEEALKGLLHACCARNQFEPGTDNESAVLIQWRRAGAPSRKGQPDKGGDSEGARACRAANGGAPEPEEPSPASPTK